MTRSRMCLGIISIVLCLINSYAFGFSGGTGEADDPYQISTAEHLISIGSNLDLLDKHYVMVADVNMADYIFTTAVIAPDTDNANLGFQGTVFSGVFEGKGYAVSNLVIVGKDFLGLFGEIDTEGKVLDLSIKNMKISSIFTYSYYISGLCGINLGSIKNCYVSGSLRSYRDIGGLCGRNQGTIMNCYSNVFVVGQRYLGGICGFNYTGSIVNCYSIGKVTGDRNLGGLCGDNYGDSITHCFWDIETSGLSTSSGGTGKTTAQMQTMSTYIDAGWDFDSADGDPAIWKEVQGWYPVLSWQDLFEVPDVTGMSYREAYNLLSNSGFRVTFTYIVSDIMPINKVANQLPASGISMPSGNVISIEVSIGSGVFENGYGTAEDPYQISRPEHLIWIGSNADLLDKHYIMTDNIDLSGYEFDTAVIAPEIENHNDLDFVGDEFTGSFDGGGYVVSGLVIDTLAKNNTGTENNDFLGLFGKIGIGGTVLNLGIEDIKITGGNNSDTIGGVCGYNVGTITNCYATGIIYGDDYIGGLCGYNDNSSIVNCYATSSINGGRCLGGLCGYESSGTITNCYATGTVTGQNELGGLCGRKSGSILTNCYATGKVTGTGFHIGGLCGYNYRGNMINCFWDTNTSGMSVGYKNFASSGNIDEDVTGLTTTQMQTMSTFIDAGWDFSVGDGDPAEWFYVPGEYPFLAWQNPVFSEVPDVTGLEASAAEDALFNAGFYSNSNNFEFSDTVPRGHVIRQIPAAGQSVIEGTIVDLIVSKGIGIIVPDVIHLSLEAAEDKISTVGLVIGVVTEWYYENIPADYVISQSPAPGILVKLESVVDLAISKGLITFSGGTGEPNDPYQISTAKELVSMSLYSELLDKHYIMVADVNLSEYNFSTAVIAPDGDNTPWDFNGVAFAGVFDGNGYTVSNLVIDPSADGNTGNDRNSYLGLFGKLDTGSKVINLGVENVNITGVSDPNFVGGLCGSNCGTITNCYATGSVSLTGKYHSNYLGLLCGMNSGNIDNCYTSGMVDGGSNSKYIGGLCGYNNGGTITGSSFTGSLGGDNVIGGICGYNESGLIINCNATGIIDGVRYLGGTCGDNRDGRIANCYAAVEVTGIVTNQIESSDGYHGGLCGRNYYGIINNSYATGEVNGEDFVGGLCGSNYGNISNCYSVGFVTGEGYVGGLCGVNAGEITNCYATGAVTGDWYWYRGGLCGRDWYGAQTINCFWDIETSGMASSAGGIGLTTIQMQTISTFIDSGWDFTDEMVNGTSEIWQMPDGGGYPVLSGMNGYLPVTLEGDGSKEDPYLINDANDLGAMYHHGKSACYRLGSDIDLAGITWSTAIIPSFGGIFEGNGHVISNMNIEGCHYLGLFGKLTGSSAKIENLGIVNINIRGKINNSDYLGGLCGYNYRGTITDCYASGSVTGGDDSGYLGGLCGYNSEGTFIDCYASGSVTGGDDSVYLGGLCGYNSRGTIINCYATGAVTGGDDSQILGGLCGWNEYGTITNCYATGAVTGDRFLGGLCGWNYYGTIINCYAAGTVAGYDYLGGLCGKNNEGTITNCYAAGTVTGSGKYAGGLVGGNAGTVRNCYASGSVAGSEYVGGFCGSLYNGIISMCYSIGTVTGSSLAGGFIGLGSGGSVENCFWDIEMSGMETSVGGVGKTTAQMQDKLTFVDAGWDFEGGWWINEGRDYPRLSWQPFGDLNNDSSVDIEDLSVMGANWGADISMEGVDRRCELSGDEVIGVDDLSIIIEAWLEGPQYDE